MFWDFLGFWGIFVFFFGFLRVKTEIGCGKPQSLSGPKAIRSDLFLWKRFPGPKKS